MLMKVYVCMYACMHMHKWVLKTTLENGEQGSISEPSIYFNETIMNNMKCYNLPKLNTCL